MVILLHAFSHLGMIKFDVPPRCALEGSHDQPERSLLQDPDRRRTDLQRVGLHDPRQVRFEYHVQNGWADYLLMDKNGGVLCVLEAKKPEFAPKDAKEQARGYAENLKAPFVILSNGKEHWFWNNENFSQALVDEKFS